MNDSRLEECVGFFFFNKNNIHLRISVSQSKNLVTVGLSNSGKGHLREPVQIHIPSMSFGSKRFFFFSPKEVFISVF